MKSALLSVAKYVAAIILLVIILKHAGLDKVKEDMKHVPPSLLLLSFTLITLALLVSALRMRFFFRASGFHMNLRYAIILFYVGGFYNFLLPGGIGGDAYKVILVRKRMSVTAKQGIRIMLADRASGLCVLMLMMSAGLMFLDLSAIPYARALLAAAFVITLIGYLVCCRWLLLQRPRNMLMSLPYSILGQLLWVAGLLSVWAPLANGRYGLEYVMLYCAASITGMLPVTVGGLGIKEMTYFYGAQLLQRYAHSGVDADVGIALSLCMFFLMLATTLPGLLWLNKVEKSHFA